MPHELIKERMVFGETVANDTVQLLVEGDIIVPDIKPDMAVILKNEADVLVDKIELSTDRIGFTAQLDIKVLYLSKGENKAVHSMNSTHAIDDFINLEGVNRDMWAGINASIANIDFKILNDRKLSYKAIVELSANVEATYEYDLVKTIVGIPENQLKMNTLNINNMVDSKDDRFIIREEINLPPGKPNIGEILQSGVHIINKDLKVQNGRVSINGDIAIYVIFKGEGGIIDFFEAEIPFNGTVDMPLSHESFLGDLKLFTEEHHIQIKENSDGEDRTFEVEVPVQAKIRLSSQNEAELLCDAFIVNKNISFIKENISYPRLVCRNKNQCSVKEIIEIPDNCPDIFQIFKVQGNVVIDSVKIIEDKVVIEGIIETGILYVAKNDDAPIYNYQTVIPFKQTVETKGSAPEMEVIIDKNIDHVGFNMLSDKEVELRFLISFNTCVKDRITAQLVTGAEINDMDSHILEAMPSIIIYVVQKGDTLWSIAKKYNVSLDELAEINELENKNLLFPGQKLLILKRIHYGEAK